MGYARKHQISLKETPHYHCVARCVRRAWLWGKDEYAGKDYSHRKYWVIERLRELCEVFALEVCAYAIMSNHYHLVLFVDLERSKEWSEEEVIARWSRIFQIPRLVDRYRRHELESTAEIEAARAKIKVWRKRLADVSWYMRCLNEHLARKANAEDECTGRFWEGRFKSQALLDEAGLLTAMAYVDLNPIRAGIAPTPEASEFTSIYDRIRAVAQKKRTRLPLKAFKDQTNSKAALPFHYTDYLQLVDWTGRSIRKDKRGYISTDLPPILERLQIDPLVWELAMQPKGNVFGRAMGKLNHLQLYARALGQEWIKGLRRAERLYRSA